MQFGRRFRRPGIGLVIGFDDPIGASSQKPAELAYIQSMMSRSEPGQIALREAKQTHGWRQAPAMFRMQWVLESLLKMNESASRLNQSFEIVCIG